MATSPTRQKEWRWMVSGGLFLGGAGGGVFIAAAGLRLLGVAPPTPVFSGLGGALLATAGGLCFLLDLGNPLRAPRAMLKVGQSWMSRGVWINGLFIAGALLHGLGGLTAFSWMPWRPGGPLFGGLELVVALLAILVMIYTGMLLADANGIPFWNTPMLPLVFVMSSLLSGTAVLSLIFLVIRQHGSMALLAKGELALYAFLAIALFCYLAVLSTGQSEARQSVGVLVRGRLAALFFIGVLGVGMVVPVTLILTGQLASGAMLSSIALAALAELLGAWLLRYAILAAGIRSQVVF